MKTPTDWLRDPSLYATSAVVLLADRWGAEFFEWDPATVSMEIRSDFGFEPDSTLMDKIQAASSLFTSNLFFVSLETFSAICNVLNFGAFHASSMTPADLDDVLWGVSEAAILMGDDTKDEKFSHNIARYVGVLLQEAGIKQPPTLLKFAEFGDYPHSPDDVMEYDAEFNKAMYDDQQEIRNTLEATNNTKIMLLFRQLQMLPLEHGDTGFIRQAFQRLGQPQPDAAASA